MVTERKISREEAERLITEHQLELLREYGCLSTWELYALHGVSHCCGGVYSRSDTELRELYRGYIERIDHLQGDELVKAIADFELSQLRGQDRITCRAIGLAGRICDGLGRHCNQEISWLFREVLGDYTVVD
ncbi:MAG TPA: hypothetical protein VJ256_03960 [Dehalococcoidia bacterium]|nr:hypothetical protein [Dehalococcoidia bacterium]HLB29453.1 hypothetical protein [Dehalococcoidia bacterium]